MAIRSPEVAIVEIGSAAARTPRPSSLRSHRTRRAPTGLRSLPRSSREAATSRLRPLEIVCERPRSRIERTRSASRGRRRAWNSRMGRVTAFFLSHAVRADEGLLGRRTLTEQRPLWCQLPRDRLRRRAKGEAARRARAATPEWDSRLPPPVAASQRRPPPNACSAFGLRAQGGGRRARSTAGCVLSKLPRLRVHLAHRDERHAHLRRGSSSRHASGLRVGARSVPRASVHDLHVARASQILRLVCCGRTHAGRGSTHAQPSLSTLVASAGSARGARPRNAAVADSFRAGALASHSRCAPRRAVSPAGGAGRYIVDFFASEVGLVVEVDGGYPARLRACADEHRDRWLRRQGYAVLRLNEELVRRQLPAALALISEQLAAVR